MKTAIDEGKVKYYSVNSISAGNDASAQGLNSIASGTTARAYKEGSIVLGQDAQSGHGLAQEGEKAVALGAGSGNVVTDSVEINNGPIINENGIDMRETRITNLAVGTERGDAVNLGQLQDTAGNLQNQINDVHAVFPNAAKVNFVTG